MEVPKQKRLHGHFQAGLLQVPLYGANLESDLNTADSVELQISGSTNADANVHADIQHVLHQLH